MTNRTAQEMIRQMKLLVKPSNRFQQTVQNRSTQVLLKQAAKLLQNIRRGQQKSQQTDKIREASTLLKQQKPYIKEYVKEKIQSKIFKSPRKNQVNQEQHSELQRQKEQVIKKRKAQMEQQQKRKIEIIENTKKYRKYEIMSQVPVFEINSLLHKEQYASKQKQQAIIPSKNNQLAEKKYHSFIGKFLKKETSQANKSSEQENLDRVITVEEQSQSQQAQIIRRNKQSKQRLQKVLQKNPKIVQILKIFLEKQFKLSSSSVVSITSALASLGISLNSQSSQYQLPTKKLFKYKAKPKTQNLEFIMAKQKSLANLAKKYKTKPYKIIPKQVESNRVICEKIINKMIGQSSKAHSKKSILTQTQLIYSEQDGKEVKRIDLQLQKIKVSDFIRSSGFFDSKQERIITITIRGKNRNFYFEKQSLEGRQLYGQLTKLMGLKIYWINSLLNKSVHPQLENFIQKTEKRVLNLSGDVVQVIGRQFSKTFRSQGFQVYLGSFKDTYKNLQVIKILNCRLNDAQVGSILQIASRASNLQQIAISCKSIGSELLQNIFLVVKNSHMNRFKLTLSQCQITDAILQESLIFLNQILNKLQYIDLSGNKITSKSLQKFGDCLRTILNCKIKYIKLDDNNLQKYYPIILIIKSCILLQQISLANCKLSIEDVKPLLQCGHKSRIKKINLQGNGALKDLVALQNLWRKQLKTQMSVIFSVEKFGKNYAQGFVGLNYKK